MKGRNRLALLLWKAAENGFDHVISHENADGDLGVGFVDSNGGRHAIMMRPDETVRDMIKEPNPR